MVQIWTYLTFLPLALEANILIQTFTPSTSRSNDIAQYKVLWIQLKKIHLIPQKAQHLKIEKIGTIIWTMGTDMDHPQKITAKSLKSGLLCTKIYLQKKHYSSIILPSLSICHYSIFQQVSSHLN